MLFSTRLRAFSYPLALLTASLGSSLVHGLEDVNAPSNALVQRASGPQPIGFNPDQNWDGIDGEWSSFTLAIGTPPQSVRVFPSTGSQQVWTVDPGGCPGTNATLVLRCSESRGNLFDVTTSTSWKSRGTYGLWVGQNLGYEGNAGYGFDKVTLGHPGENGPTVDNVVVAHYQRESYWLGIFGLHPKPTNFTNYTDSSPSYMSMLFDNKRIPSKSFGYTAGSKNRFSGVQASLTLGGYDSSKFIPSNVSFILNVDNERDLLISLNSVTTSESPNPLLTTPIYALIDSTFPEMWLPLEVCQKFEQAFGLIYDNTTSLYFINETQRNALRARNATVSFKLAQLPGADASQSVDLVFPYYSFDHRAKPPYRGMSIERRYFPLRRAQDPKQYTLGRVFLQEAYIVVDWERKNFTVNAVNWDFTAPQNLMAIISPDRKDSASGLALGAIIGIAVGGGAVLLAAAIGFFFWRRSQKRKEQRKIKLDVKTGLDSPGEPNGSDVKLAAGNVIPKVELDATPVIRDDKGNIIDVSDTSTLLPPATPSSPGTATYLSGSTLSPLVESDAKELHVFEMEGDMPVRQEADGLALSEKQAMVRREQIYNGIDPTPSPTYMSPQATLPPITPDGTISPVTPDHRRVHPQEIVEISPATIGPGSTLNTHLLVPGSETRDPNRRRFSYEEGED